MSVPCDAGLVYDVLTDYESYAEWLPMVVASKTLAREGDLAIAEFELSTRHKDKFDFECIHTRNKMVLWRTLDGRLPIAQAEWTISGAGNACEVTLAVTGKIHWGQFLPGARDFLKPSQCVRALHSQLSTYMPESGAPDLAIRNEAGDDTGFGSKICHADADNLSDWRCHADPRKFDSPHVFRHGSEVYLLARRNVTSDGVYDRGGPLRMLSAIRNELSYITSAKRCALWRVVPSGRVAFVRDLPSRGDTL